MRSHHWSHILISKIQGMENSIITLYPIQLSEMNELLNMGLRMFFNRAMVDEKQ